MALELPYILEAIAAILKLNLDWAGNRLGNWGIVRAF